MAAAYGELHEHTCPECGRVFSHVGYWCIGLICCCPDREDCSRQNRERLMRTARRELDDAGWRA